MNSLKIHTHTHTHTHTHIHRIGIGQKNRRSHSLAEVNTKQFAMATILNPGP